MQMTTRWSYDASHAKVGFRISHFGISETEGKFTKFDGIVLSDNEDFSDANIDFTIDVNSINTEDVQRDQHLKSADFFDVDKFPVIHFKSKSLRAISKNAYQLTGDLSMHGVIQEITLDATYNGTVIDPFNNTKAGFKILLYKRAAHTQNAHWYLARHPKVPGYREEPGVDPQSRTETFVALQIFIDNWRWAGVPFFLRTGKRLPKRASEISVHLKEVPPILFNANASARLDPNVLSIRIQPDEGFSLGISSKLPGPNVRVYPVKMDFHYGSTFGGSSPEAYERLLLDVIAGDPTLFMRRDAVEAAWRWVMPILERWAETTTDPLPAYPAGDWGPLEAERLLESTGRRWRAL
jgi:polyisoprenoid-binding protein YceI